MPGLAELDRVKEEVRNRGEPGTSAPIQPEAERAQSQPAPDAQAMNAIAAASPPDTVDNHVLNLDGTTGYFELPADTFSTLSEATVECRVNWERFQHMSRVFDFVIGRQLVVVMNRDTNPDLFVESYIEGKRRHVELPAALSADRWINLAVTVGPNELTVFVDGIPVPQKFTEGPDNYRSSEYTRRNLLGLSNAKIVWRDDQLFAGQVDELRVWNRLLSPAEIRAGMDAKLTGAEPELAGWWNFDDPLNPGRDSSTGAHDGKLIGKATIIRPGTGSKTSPQPASTTVVTGDPTSAMSSAASGYALRFELNDWLQLSPIDWAALPAFTFEVWVRDWSGTIGGQGKSGDPENSLWIGLGQLAGKDQYHTSGWESNGRNKEYRFGASPANRWVHIAMVFDGKSQSFYLDGQLKHQVAAPRPGPFDMRRSLTFASGSQGELRSARISSMARYHSDFRPDVRWTADPQTLVLLEAGNRAGGLLKDLSSHGHDAKIHGTPVYVPDSK